MASPGWVLIGLRGQFCDDERVEHLLALMTPGHKQLLQVFDRLGHSHSRCSGLPWVMWEILQTAL